MIELPRTAIYWEMNLLAEQSDLTLEERLARMTDLKKQLARFSGIHPLAPISEIPNQERDAMLPHSANDDLSDGAMALFRQAPDAYFEPEEWITHPISDGLD